VSSGALSVKPNRVYETFIVALTIVALIGVACIYLLEVFRPHSPVLPILNAADTMFCIVGMALMMFGIVIFGVLTSFLSSVFLAETNGSVLPGSEREQRLETELAALRHEVARLSQLLQDRLPS